MPKLENPKHEEFCLYLARGYKQGDAYVRAGYSENKGAASRLSRTTAITERVDELRREIKAKVETAIAVPSADNWQSLEDMGLTLEWVAAQYKTIYDQAILQGALAPANVAIQSIQKLIEMERNAKPEVPAAFDNKFNISDMLQVLDKVGDILKVTTEHPVEVPGDFARLISPAEDITQ
jgi:hypothetical protein